jgi:hypothetical protein
MINSSLIFSPKWLSKTVISRGTSRLLTLPGDAPLKAAEFETFRALNVQQFPLNSQGCANSLSTRAHLLR